MYTYVCVYVTKGDSFTLCQLWNKASNIITKVMNKASIIL